MPGFLLFGKRLCSNRLKDWGIQVSITSLAVQHVSQWRFGYDFTLKHRARFKICYTHLEIERRYWRWLLGKETHLSNIWWLWVSMLNLRACWIQINSSLSSFNNHGHWKMGPRNRNEFRFLRKVPKGHVPLRQLFLRKKTDSWLVDTNSSLPCQNYDMLVHVVAYYLHTAATIPSSSKFLPSRSSRVSYHQISLVDLDLFRLKEHVCFQIYGVIAPYLLQMVSICYQYA